MILKSTCGIYTGAPPLHFVSMKCYNSGVKKGLPEMTVSWLKFLCQYNVCNMHYDPQVGKLRPGGLLSLQFSPQNLTKLKTSKKTNVYGGPPS